MCEENKPEEAPQKEEDVVTKDDLLGSIDPKNNKSLDQSGIDDLLKDLFG